VLGAANVVAALVAVPPDSTADPKLLPSRKNCTVPFRVPDPGTTGLTVAVKVTDCPTTEGLADEVIVVLVEAWFTIWDNGDEVLVVKLVSALYVAVIECPPTASVVVVNAAVLPVRLTVPSEVAPSLNVTVPVGVPAPGATAATVAVKVNDWPRTDGLVPLVSATVVVVLAWLTV